MNMNESIIHKPVKPGWDHSFKKKRNLIRKNLDFKSEMEHKANPVILEP